MRILPVALAAGALVGCIERKLVLRTDPPDARVYLDHRRLLEKTPDGETLTGTPLSSKFVYYGPRVVQIEKDGYRTLDAEIFLPPPIYEYPFLDLATTVLWPFPFTDEHVFTFKLEPLPDQTEADVGAMMTRADGLRGEVTKMKNWRWTPVIPRKHEPAAPGSGSSAGSAAPTPDPDGKSSAPPAAPSRPN